MEHQGRLFSLTPTVFHEHGSPIALMSPHRKLKFRSMNMPYFDPRRVALLEKQPGVTPQKPESSYAKINKFTSGEISIDAFTSKPSLLILSEIYYPAGWKAYIDGNETEIYKTNYILRSVIVPEGKHKIEYRFESQSYDLGYTITKAGWGICGVILIIGIVQIRGVRNRLKKNKDGEKEPTQPV
jgi:hypothetical protein